MKVIAIKRNGTYICEIDHSEIEKFMNQYYGKLTKLKEGDQLDLGKGYSFFNETKRALKKTQEFLESNQEIISTILSGITIIGVDQSEKEDG